MQKVQQGHNVLSLFGASAQSQALNEKIASNGLAVSLISAFFIVLAVGLMLGASNKILSTPTTMAATTVIEEKVAFTPGQFISEKISQGYLSNY